MINKTDFGMYQKRTKRTHQIQKIIPTISEKKISDIAILNHVSLN